MGLATNSAIQANANKPRPYNGDEMILCPIHSSDFNHTCAVIVTGDGINACGHTLLHIGDSWYVHIAGLYNRPKFLHESGYQRYLKENGKKEIRRWLIMIPNPTGAHARLHELTAKPWFWGIVAHNCSSFAEDVVRAGGSNAGQYLNCPLVEPFA
jgi:hypothetical protein